MASCATYPEGWMLRPDAVIVKRPWRSDDPANETDVVW